MRIGKLIIDFKSFMRPVGKLADEPFGHYHFSAPQGAGKTFAMVRFLSENSTGYKVYSNVQTLKLDHIPFSSLDEILDNNEEHCIFVIDEIFKKYVVGARADQRWLAWVNHSRKCKRIVLTTSQSWLDLPIWFRRTVSKCVTIRKWLFNFRFYTWGDAENMLYDKELGEYVCPPFLYRVTRLNKKTAALFDTHEKIAPL